MAAQIWTSFGITLSPRICSMSIIIIIIIVIIINGNTSEIVSVGFDSTYG
jgi:hypothetical protein